MYTFVIRSDSNIKSQITNYYKLFGTQPLLPIRASPIIPKTHSQSCFLAGLKESPLEQLIPTPNVSALGKIDRYANEQHM